MWPTEDAARRRFAAVQVRAYSWPLPLAHTGHVLVDLAMFAPVLVLVIWFLIISVRDRRRGIDRDADG
jgi:hypothetical protein